MKFNIQESREVKKFLGVYHKWGCGVKVSYAKTTMEKEVKKLVHGYNNFIRSDVKVQKTPGAPGTTLSKSELENQNI